jgi:hypothetical protein
MRKCLFFWISILAAFHGNGKEDPQYAISEIPEALKTGMYAVIRTQELRFEINSEKSATT